jgi:hypothetical protein
VRTTSNARRKGRDRAAIKTYAGDDIDKVRHLPKDKDYLIDPEDTVRHYDVKADEWEQ